jgi:Xaa-Pro aminopeptidase
MAPWPPYDASALRADRTGRVTDFMRSRNLDHLLLTGFDSIRYALDARFQIISEGFDWFVALMDVSGEGEVFVPWVDEDVVGPDPDAPAVRLTHPLPSWSPAVVQIEYWTAAIAAALSRLGARTVGFDLIDATLVSALRGELPDVEFVGVARELYDLRALKLPAEIALLEAASLVNCAAADAAIDGARPGLRDYDVLALAMASLQAAGVEYLTHSLCNVRRGSGTWFAAGQTLREGDAFFFDIGCYGRGGYASDIARVGFVGDPPAVVSRAYRQLLDAHHVGEERARPGANVSDIHAAINDYLRRQGLPITPYGTGHGIGLRACEPPTIHRSDRTSRNEVLVEGMTIALEPETQVEVDGVLILLKVEDNYVVESDGVRRLTTAPRLLPIGAAAR